MAAIAPVVAAGASAIAANEAGGVQGSAPVVQAKAPQDPTEGLKPQPLGIDSISKPKVIDLKADGTAVKQADTSLLPESPLLARYGNANQGAASAPASASDASGSGVSLGDVNTAAQAAGQITSIIAALSQKNQQGRPEVVSPSNLRDPQLQVSSLGVPGATPVGINQWAGGGINLPNSNVPVVFRGNSDLLKQLGGY